jgi:hypothetical protein
VLCIAASAAEAQSDDVACPADLATALDVATWAWVNGETPNNLRAAPGLAAERIGQIPAGDLFRVLVGPLCADGYVWWEVNYAGTLAWTAEGEQGADQSWLAVLDTITPPAEDDPEGCARPPESYERIEVGYGVLNLRTLAMLDNAQRLYTAAGGTARFREAVMQGSYNPGGVSASFGTHDGGGAVDLAVRDRQTRNVLTADIPLMLDALRRAGFAAWLRDTDELYPGSPIHIHAIAVGDAELSEAARGQIDGTFGYLRGYNGLPQGNGIPLPDTSGEMIICTWMKEMGFDDLRP